MDDFDKNFVLKSHRFYSSDEDKTLGNWFVYELSNELYDALAELVSHSGTEVDEELAVFSIKLARDVLKQVKKFPARKFKYVKISRKIAEEETPGKLSSCNTRDIAKALTSALKEQLEICEMCPTRCVFNPGGKCYMFDEGPY